jgi:cell wall-associated NlpC family hydrolase
MARRNRVALLRVPVLAAALLSAVSLAPTAAQARFGDQTLRQGDSGSDVRGLQRALNLAGYETEVDGQFGPHTFKRVRAFEGNEGLRVDGQVTRSNARRLRKAARRGPAGAEEPPGSDVDTTPDAGEAPGSRATLTSDGLAIPPAEAPDEVKDAIRAGNEIAEAPYKYGGGHGSRLRDSGYDCSGSISYALRKAGLMKNSMASGSMMRFGASGRGRWITIYANSGHAYMMIAGLRFDTSARKRTGTRWSDTRRRASGYTRRHPSGF